MLLLKNLMKDKFLQQQWSPQQISERIRVEKPEYFVSYNTIWRMKVLRQ